MRIGIQPVVYGLLLAALAVPAAGQDSLHRQEHPDDSPILASYDFEASTPSGPDTHWVRQRDGSVVALSSAFRFSGERSLLVSEVPGNRDFAEFLAYFEERREGDVYIQFYLLLTDAEQRFNFGLAGPRWFLSTEQHGHAIWLQTDGGLFRHRPAGDWEPLFEPRLFAWHFIDIVYHVASGTYDLRIREEGLEEPLVDIYGVRAMHGQQESAVQYFSLIGDLEDAGRFDFFVDDLLIATVPEVRLEPFVAPGRRRYFVETLAVEPRRELSDTARTDLFLQARAWLDALGPESGSQELDRLEAAADEAFLSGYLETAGGIYQRLVEYPDRSVRILLKLADHAHLAGDVEAERELRESIYGRLDVED